MLTRTELRKIARARLRDAEILFSSKRYDGAVYLCGYAIEVALKARICRTLRWADFPSTGGEFHGLQSFRTHSLDILLRLSGVESKIKADFLSQWSAVAVWAPETRYKPIGSAAGEDAQLMIESATILLRVL